MDQTTFVGAQFNEASQFDTAIDALAEQTRAPRVLVETLYFRELANLERTAKIKTFVPVLTHRRVKAPLRAQRHS